MTALRPLALALALLAVLAATAASARPLTLTQDVGGPLASGSATSTSTLPVDSDSSASSIFSAAVTHDNEGGLLSLASPSALKVSGSSISAAVHESLARPGLYEHLEHPLERIRRAAQSALNCSVCEAVVSLLVPALNSTSTEAALVWLATKGCEVVKPLCHSPSACAAVCQGIVSEYESEVFTLLVELATPLAVCAALKECPKPPTPAPSTAIPVRSDLRDTTGETVWASWDLTQGTGTFVHLSDAHIDWLYREGAPSSCGLPVCCHVGDTPPSVNATNATAGFWGDYACDTPPQLAQSLLDFLAGLDPLPDFVIYTGDDPAHDVWKQSREENLAALALWNDMLAASFEGLSIPVFSALGNHAVFPVNQFQGPGLDDWLYDAVLQHWAPYLPQDAQATFAYGGYYQLRARPGLRIVSLNSNYFTKSEPPPSTTNTSERTNAIE